MFGTRKGTCPVGLVAGVVSSAVVLSLTGAAYGQFVGELAEYRFDNGSRASIDRNDRSVASTFNDGPGITSEIESADGNPVPSVEVHAPQASNDAVADDDYFNFTVEHVAGGQLDFDQIAYDYFVGNEAGGGFNADSFLRWSVDDFSQDLLAIGSSTNEDYYEIAVADLSDSAPQSGPVEFRLYLEDGSNSGSKVHRIDNVTLDGTATAVNPTGADAASNPEPSTLAIFGLGGLALIGRRRRRHA